MGGNVVSTSRGLLLGGALGQRCIAVDVIETNCEAENTSEFNQAARHIRRHRLPALVMADISLSAAKAIGHRLLSDAESNSEELQVVHARLLVALVFMSILALVVIRALV